VPDKFRGDGRPARAQREGYVRASDVAKLGYCEAKVFFDARYGEELPPERVERRLGGQSAHEQFHRDGQVGATPGDRRCFVATMCFGPDAYETDVLRAFRDRVLLVSLSGRAFVRAYYAISPWLCRVMARVPGGTAASRLALRAAVKLMVWWHP
jgi:hypothetical protein